MPEIFSIKPGKVAVYNAPGVPASGLFALHNFPFSLDSLVITKFRIFFQQKLAVKLTLMNNVFLYPFGDLPVTIGVEGISFYNTCFPNSELSPHQILQQYFATKAVLPGGNLRFPSFIQLGQLQFMTFLVQFYMQLPDDPRTLEHLTASYGMIFIGFPS